MTTPPNQEVRRAAEADRSAAALPGARLLTIGALVFIPLFAFFDGIVAPPELALLRIWRVLTFAVVALAFLALSTDVGRRRALACGIAVILAFGLNVEFLAVDGTIGTHYYAAVVIALLAGWLALPWRPMQVACVGLGLVGVYAGGTLSLIGTRDAAQFLSHVVLVAGASALVAAAATVRERERWRACAHRVGLEAYARRQETIASIGQLGFRTRDPHVLLERAIVWIGDALGTSQCGIWKLERDGKTLHLTAGIGWNEDVVGQATLDAHGRSHPAAVSRNNDPVVVEDLPAEKRFDRVGVFRDHAITSGVGTVLRVHQEVSAVLTVYSATSRVFTRDEIEFLRATVRLLGSAMGEYQEEQASKNDAKASGALARAGRDLLSSLDPEVLLERLCQLTREIVGCDQSSTWFVDWDRQVLEPTTAAGIPDELWQAVRDTPIALDALRPTLGRLAREEVVPLLAETADAPVQRVLGALGIPSALLVLLRRDGEPVGLQMLGRTSGERFTRQDERVAQGITQLAGMALTNARLVEQLAAEAPVAHASTPRAGFGAAPKTNGANGIATGDTEQSTTAPTPDSDRHLGATRANTTQVQAIASTADAPRRKQLLFADDLSMARILLRHYLDREMPEIELLEAFDGAQALAMVEAHRPDLVILDLQMPVLDGYQAASRIRQLTGMADLPIIATSINVGLQVESAAVASGFTEFIAKPVSDYGPLAARIRYWLGNKRGLDVRPVSSSSPSVALSS